MLFKINKINNFLLTYVVHSRFYASPSQFSDTFLNPVTTTLFFYQQKGAWLRNKHLLNNLLLWKLNNSHTLLHITQYYNFKRIKQHFKPNKLISLQHNWAYAPTLLRLTQHWSPNSFSRHGFYKRPMKTALFKSGKKSSYMQFKNKFF